MVLCISAPDTSNFWHLKIKFAGTRKFTLRYKKFEMKFNFEILLVDYTYLNRTNRLVQISQFIEMA